MAKEKPGPSLRLSNRKQIVIALTIYSEELQGFAGPGRVQYSQRRRRRNCCPQSAQSEISRKRLPPRGYYGLFPVVASGFRCPACLPAVFLRTSLPGDPEGQSRPYLRLMQGLKYFLDCGLINGTPAVRRSGLHPRIRSTIAIPVFDSLFLPAAKSPHARIFDVLVYFLRQRLAVNARHSKRNRNDLLFFGFQRCDLRLLSLPSVQVHQPSDLSLSVWTKPVNVNVLES